MTSSDIDSSRKLSRNKICPAVFIEIGLKSRHFIEIDTRCPYSDIMRWNSWRQILLFLDKEGIQNVTIPDLEKWLDYKVKRLAEKTRMD